MRRLGAVTADPSSCTEAQTQRFVEQVVGEGLKGKAALKACRKTPDRGVADSAKVSDITVDGGRATANVALTGSTFGGQTLDLALSKDGRWKVDEFTPLRASPATP